MAILLFVLGIVLFIGLVVIHEYGHFVVARRNGVEVEEFGLFFPPRLYRRRTKSGWLFTINALPLGGFVKLKGEHDGDVAKGTFGAASTWAKTKIMLAGVFMNLLVALLLLTVLAWLGMPKLVPNQFTVKSDSHAYVATTAKAGNLVDRVEPGSPAQRAGIRTGDRLIAIGPAGHPQKLVNPDDLPSLTKRYAGRPVTVQLVRHGRQLSLTAQLPTAQQVKAAHKPAYLGVVTTAEFGQSVTLLRSTWSAPVVAAGLSAQVTVLTFQGLGHAVAGVGSLLAGLATGNTTARQHGQTAATAQVAGPVGIFFIMKNGSLLGYQFMLFIVAIISLTLAIMNVLPIPALDGGRLWLMLASRLTLRRPLSAGMEETINAFGFLFLIGLMILITIVDVHRSF